MQFERGDLFVRISKYDAVGVNDGDTRENVVLGYHGDSISVHVDVHSTVCRRAGGNGQWMDSDGFAVGDSFTFLLVGDQVMEPGRDGGWDMHWTCRWVVDWVCRTERGE